MSLAARLLALPVRAYRLVLSPWLGHACRFQPTCSAYALEALERHGAVRGGWLALRRILRCRPGAAHGYDPVPEPSQKRRAPPADDGTRHRCGDPDEAGASAGQAKREAGPPRPS